MGVDEQPCPGRLDDALVRNGVAPLRKRRAVVSFGSNSDPTVLRRKFASAGVSLIAPMAPARLANARLAASAHVSRPGYIAAAVLRAEGAHLPVAVAWLDAPQVRCLNATERNYDLSVLDGGVHPVTRGGEIVQGAALYVTTWGVIDLGADDLRSQVGVWRAVLRRSTSLRALVRLEPDASEVAIRKLMARMARDDTLRAGARKCLRQIAVPSRLAGAGA